MQIWQKDVEEKAEAKIMSMVQKKMPGSYFDETASTTYQNSTPKEKPNYNI